MKIDVEEFYEWLDTCPVRWTEGRHPTSGMTLVNFDLEDLEDTFDAHSYRGYSYERPLGMKVLGVGIVVALGLGLLGLGAANE
jgi:hypothetical protein